MDGAQNGWSELLVVPSLCFGGKASRASFRTSKNSLTSSLAFFVPCLKLDQKWTHKRSEGLFGTTLGKQIV